MATVNQLQPIESILTPDESNWFRKNAPHFLDALRMQQTVINQLIIRAGGSGPGSGVTDLSDLTAQADATENWLGGVASIAARRSESVETAQYDAMAANIGKLRLELAKISVRIDEVESNRMMLGQILANQKAMKQQIEELEAVCLSSLAR